jgi:Tol biopolymer transport system component
MRSSARHISVIGICATLGAVATYVMASIAPASALATVPAVNGRLAFSSYGKIYTVQPDGSELTPVIRILEDEKQDFAPAWSPDGTSIATGGQILIHHESLPYGRWSGEDINIFLPDGTGFARLTTPNQWFSADPTWSPDGSRIAYVTDDIGYASISSASPHGGQVRLLIAGTQGQEIFDPAWSPDGTRLAFAREMGFATGDTDLFTMQSDGSDVRKLVERPGYDYHPSWSPDGRTIVFAGGVGDERNLYTVPASGGEPVQLTHAGSDVDPAWAPDGSAIVFASNRATPPGQTRLDLYVMDADGGRQRRITDIGCLQCHPDWQALGFVYRAPSTPPPSSPPPTEPTRSPATARDRSAHLPRKSIDSVQVTPREFRASVADKVRMSLWASAPRQLTFSIARMRLSKRARLVRHATRRVHAGANRLSLARLFPGALEPGRYRLRISSRSGFVYATVALRVRS